jgi:hypothetical protein
MLQRLLLPFSQLRFRHRYHSGNRGTSPPQKLRRIKSPREVRGYSSAYNTNANIIASDKEVFDKWGQSLASAEELVEDSYWEGSNDSPSVSYVAVIPMVVVPDGRLWIAEHDSDGNCEHDPHLTDRCSVFVNHEYRMGPERISLRVSHVEFVTFSRLGAFVTECLNNREGIDTIFPYDTLDTFEGDLRAGRVSF